MTIPKLIARLEAFGYLFVTVVDDNIGHGGGATLTAVDPSGYQIIISVDGDMVLDRRIDSELWDIMFIGEESFL